MARTVDLKVEDIWSNINSQFKNKEKDLEWFSLSLDETTDFIDVTQLLIWGINTKFEVAEKLASVNNLCRTTSGKNIFKVEKTLSTIWSGIW